MRWVGITIFLLIIGSGWYWLFPLPSSPSSQPNASDKKEKSNSSTYVVTSVSSSLFIPYWNIPTSTSEVNDFDSLIYFGVSPDETGELIRDSGFMNIDSFLENTSQDKKRLLTVRMLNTENNLDILEDASRQSLVINQTLDLVEQYGFDGVVLDLEVGVIPLENVTNSITTFVSDFAREARTSDVTFAITIYGDSFYRARPYDVEKLAHAVDQVYIMAYDFHKSRGEPGPNFPFSNKQEYGYDFQTMTDDFIQIVPREKITVLFGMYGYDWTLGAQGKPLKAAKAMPLWEIEQGYGDCNIVISTEANEESGVEKSLTLHRDSSTEFILSLPNVLGMTECNIIENSISQEKHIRYVDPEGYDHSLWYEDKESIKVKIEYLKEQGIGSIGYWVWGYF